MYNKFIVSDNQQFVYIKYKINKNKKIYLKIIQGCNPVNSQLGCTMGVSGDAFTIVNIGRSKHVAGAASHRQPI